MPGRIATLTVNPAVDLASQAASVKPGRKIPTFGERYDAGGGGINVAKVVCELGGEALALFASGGATGRYVEEMLTTAKVPWQSVRIAGACRVSVTVRDQSKEQEYRFVPQGPELTAAECADILGTLGEIKADWVVASGSLPPGVPADFYAQAARIVRARGMNFALDTSGAALASTLGQGISLLKPNLPELESIVGREVRSLPAQMAEAKRLAEDGAAEMIALTLGAAGAIVATKDSVLRLPAIAVSERTGVGAGDSFLAGLVFGLVERRPLKEVLRLGLACGAAAVRGTGTAQVRRACVEALLASGLSPVAAAVRNDAHSPSLHD